MPDATPPWAVTVVLTSIELKNIMRAIWAGGDPEDLSPNEYDLLAKLARALKEADAKGA